MKALSGDMQHVDSIRECLHSIYVLLNFSAPVECFLLLLFTYDKVGVCIVFGK